MVRVLWRCPGAQRCREVRGVRVGEAGTVRSLLGELRPQLNPGVRERREEAMETEVKART